MSSKWGRKTFGGRLSPWRRLFPYQPSRSASFLTHVAPPRLRRRCWLGQRSQTFSEPTSPFLGEAPSQDARLRLGAPRVQEERRAAGCPDASEPAGHPAEGTTEEPMTLVGSVARKLIVQSHQAEEFVSQDVVGEWSVWLGHSNVRPAPCTQCDLLISS